MQPQLKDLALWYKDWTGFTLSEMQSDLRAVLSRRQKALYDGPTTTIKRSLAFAEIIKAAICLETGQDYETSFSDYQLAQFRRYADPKRQMYTCRHCGNEYPAFAFAPGSRYCIRCAAEIKQISAAAAAYKKAGGYINRKGAIICTGI